MSTTVTYKGATLTTAENQTRVLNTSGTWLEDNITITDVEGTFLVTLSLNSSTGYWTPDCTYAEVLAANNAGQTIAVVTDVGADEATAGSAGVASNRWSYWVRSYDADADQMVEASYYINSGGVYLLESYNYVVPPSGTLSITSNGVHNVERYANVNVSVSGGVGTLLNTTSLGSISTSSTTAASVATVSVSGVNTYDLLIVDCSVNTETNNRHTSTVSVVFLTGSSNAATTKNGNVIATAKWNSKKNSSGTHLSYQSTTAYGIYVNSCSISSGTASLGIYRRYNSTQTGTINGTYTCRTYGVNLIDLIGG